MRGCRPGTRLQRSPGTGLQDRNKRNTLHLGRNHKKSDCFGLRDLSGCHAPQVLGRYPRLCCSRPFGPLCSCVRPRLGCYPKLYCCWPLRPGARLTFPRVSGRYPELCCSRPFRHYRVHANGNIGYGEVDMVEVHNYVAANDPASPLVGQPACRPSGRRSPFQRAYPV